MVPRDPLRILSVECSSAVFEYLSASDVARCEGVSRGWGDFVRRWIVSFGLRLFYQHELDIHALSDPEERLQEYRRQVALRRNLKLGQPSSVRKYESAKSFTVSGKYGVWIKHNEGVFCQDLSPRADGSLHPVRQLDSVDPLASCYLAGHLLTLGANGHLLVRYPLEPRPGQEVRDTLYCLESGRQLWSHDSRFPGYSDDDYAYIPLCVGEKRVYFGTVSSGSRPSRIRAYGLRSGDLLYDAETIAHTATHLGRPDTREYPYGHPLEILKVGKDEVLLAFKPDSKAAEWVATIHLINGADGTLRQGIRIIHAGVPYVALSTNCAEFAIVSHRSHHPIVKIQTFACQNNGEFAASRVDLVDTQTACKAGLLAIDPFADCIVSLVGDRNIPHCAKLVECVDPKVVSSIREQALKAALISPAPFRYLVATDPRQISLPPSSQRARLRRRFPPKAAVNARRMRLRHGHRASLMCNDGDGFDVYTVYLFDFMPKP
ncbi:uncharacterized protein BJX67DRAFT_77994 [Aspergillus lucknowensis]|uniref:F-box domain-containing protein n=1 Tax=Aspergillus lucknowensis TaxID=176173 RepID=A0ABR4LUL1_9EURO